ncbi:hypothetical protein Tco_0821200 [Tanacetum coccineum]|uniref:Uncharacterized protein n=1 Tax=Tanacetum coccineum TaxID=301880 RepID=A0ABQ5AFT8_9ASTR
MVDDSVPNDSNDPPSGEDRLQLNELMDLCLSARVISSDDEEPDLEIQDDKFTHGRRIVDLDEDKEVTLVDEV